MAVEQSFPLLPPPPPKVTADADLESGPETKVNQYGSIRLRVAWAGQSAPLPAKKPATATSGGFAAMCFLPQCTTKPVGVIPVDAPTEHEHGVHEPDE
jgi:hypothetical protein